MSPKVSVIIVSYNTCGLLRDIITQFTEQLRGHDCEIVVVDNASHDDSVAMLRRDFPHVKVLAQDRNLGFAAANNRGIESSTGDLLFLSNTDIVLSSHCVSSLMDFMSTDERIGLLGPKVLNQDGTLQRTAKRDVTLLRTLFRALWIDFLFPTLSFPPTDITRDVDVLAGCFWLARRTALQQVGLFDERFFFYGEDRDLCRRLRMAQWRVVYYPATTVIHFGGGSSQNASPAGPYVLLTKANLSYWSKYHSAPSVMVFRLLQVLHSCLRLLTNGAAVMLLRGPARIRAKAKAHRSVAALSFLLGSDRLHR